MPTQILEYGRWRPRTGFFPSIGILFLSLAAYGLIYSHNFDHWPHMFVGRVLTMVLSGLSFLAFTVALKRPGNIGVTAIRCALLLIALAEGLAAAIVLARPLPRVYGVSTAQLKYQDIWELGQDITVYANDHHGTAPSALKDLLDDEDPEDRPDLKRLLARETFVYFGGSSYGGSKAPLVIERPVTNESSVFELRADFSVVQIPRSEAEAELNKHDRPN